jgi:hypothetical protein
MPPILLGQQCVEGVSRSHRPNPGTLLTDFPGGLIKVWGVHICSSKDCLCCPRDGVVPKPTLQYPVADGSILCQKELLAVDVRKNCLLNRLCSGVLRQCALLLTVLHQHTSNRSTVGLSHDKIHPLPEAPILFLLDDSQYLLLALVILTIPCILKTFIEMLSLVALAMNLEIVALFNAGLETLEDLLHQEC